MKKNPKRLTVEDIKQFCMIDRKAIPMDRIVRRCGTCSAECQRTLRKQRNAIIESRKCLHCYKPSSLEDREQFRRFRAYLAKEGKITLPRTGRRPKNAAEAIHKPS